MEPLFYVMAIMGCDDGSAQCAQARLEPAHYQSLQLCQAAMGDALRKSDIDYPVVTATCQGRGMMMTRVDNPHRRNG
ncbi:MAG: hypothetical protein M3R41_10340 [Pseudomonadota bacterium]|nr:hypothetical protein [Pseudomonadota bacterium]